MSNDDYVVDPRRDSEVRWNGKRLRKFLGLTDVDLIDVLILEGVTEIWTEKGVKPFRLEVVPDEDLPDDSGLTSYDGSKILVRIPRRIRHDAFMGHGYSRYTIVHELGHATQHLDKLMLGASMPRRRVGKRHARLDTKVQIGRAPSYGLRSRLPDQRRYRAPHAVAR
jgi:hypothetical protein